MKTKLPEKIDVNNIRGHWTQNEILSDKDGFLSIGTKVIASGYDTIKSIKLFADKINAIIDYLNSKEGEEK